MITFVDTNVLLDVFLPDPKWGETSKNSLDQAYVQGSLIINEIIYAELAQMERISKKRRNTQPSPGGFFNRGSCQNACRQAFDA